MQFFQASSKILLSLLMPLKQSILRLGLFPPSSLSLEPEPRIPLFWKRKCTIIVQIWAPEGIILLVVTNKLSAPQKPCFVPPPHSNFLLFLGLERDASFFLLLLGQICLAPRFSLLIIEHLLMMHALPCSSELEFCRGWPRCLCGD